MQQQLAELMVEATINILHPLCKDEHKGTVIEVRTGNGFATYHKNHRITYGIKMLKHKQLKEQALGWTTGKEIIHRNYFNDFTYKNLIIATILHEYAHFIQTVKGFRYYKEVHNKAFYNILDGFYNKGYHLKIEMFLMKHDVFRNAAFKESRIKKELTKKDLINAKYLSSYKEDKLEFFKILKLNPRTVVTTNHDGSYIFTIPYRLIVETFDEKPSTYNEIGAGKRNKLYTKSDIEISSRIVAVFNGQIESCVVIDKIDKYVYVTRDNTRGVFKVKYIGILNVEKNTA